MRSYVPEGRRRRRGAYVRVPRCHAIVDASGRGRGNLSTVATPHASFPIDDDPFAPYEVIGELGSRPLPVYVARQTTLATSGGQLVVAERFAGAAKAGNAAGADLRREARRLTTLANPHLARVREIASRGDDLVVFGDFIDGEKLSQFWPSVGGTAALRFGALSLDVALRILLDVLTGAGALHGLRDTRQQPMKLTHGEISPPTCRARPRRLRTSPPRCTSATRKTRAPMSSASGSCCGRRSRARRSRQR